MRRWSSNGDRRWEVSAQPAAPDSSVSHRLGVPREKPILMMAVRYAKDEIILIRCAVGHRLTSHASQSLDADHHNVYVVYLAGNHSELIRAPGTMPQHEFPVGDEVLEHELLIPNLDQPKGVGYVDRPTPVMAFFLPMVDECCGQYVIVDIQPTHNNISCNLLLGNRRDYLSTSLALDDCRPEAVTVAQRMLDMQRVTASELGGPQEATRRKGFGPDQTVTSATLDKRQNQC